MVVLEGWCFRVGTDWEAMAVDGRNYLEWDVGRSLNPEPSTPNTTGVPHLQESAPPYDPNVGLRLGSYGGPRGWVFSGWGRLGGDGGRRPQLP